MSEVKGELATYTHLDNDVHRIVYNISSNTTTDEYLQYLERLIETCSPETTLLLLVDMRPDGSPSVSYAFRSAKRLFAKHPNAPKMRGAYLLRSGGKAFLMDHFLKLLHLNSSRRFYIGDKEDEAIAWLLSD